MAQREPDRDCCEREVSASREAENDTEESNRGKRGRKETLVAARPMQHDRAGKRYERDHIKGHRVGGVVDDHRGCLDDVIRVM